MLFGKTYSLKLAFSIDSVRALIESTSIDTNKAQYYFVLSNLQRQNQKYKAAIESMEKSRDLAIKTDFKRVMRAVYIALSDLYYLSGDLKSLANYYKTTITYCKAVSDSKFLAYNYRYAGDFQVNILGEDDISLQYYDSAIAVYKKRNNMVGLADIYNAIAGVYYKNLDYPKAAKELQKVLKLYAADTSKNTRSREATMLQNLGMLYELSGDTSKAIEAYVDALAIDSITKDFGRSAHRHMALAQIDLVRRNYKSAHRRLVKAISYIENDLEYYYAHEIYNSMGDLFFVLYQEANKSAPNLKDEASLELADYAADSIQYYYRKSFDITKPKGMVLEQAHILKRLAMYSVADEDHEQAYELITQSLLLYDSANASLENYKIYHNIAEINANLKDFEPAYFNLKRFIEIDDSIMTQDQRISLAKQTTAFDYEKKMLVLNQEKELQLQNEEKQRMIIWFGCGGICVLILFIIFGYNRYKVTQKQHRIIGLQKKELFDKNTKIMSSINYAQRIQYSLLPDEIHLIFPDIFIHYHPRDIVSGDFFWAHESLTHKYLVVADCTGHGVPGAFMSILGISLLDKIVGQMRITEPKDILTQLSKDVSKRLQKEGDFMSSDGMDISLVRFDKNTNEIIFSGAGSKALCIENEFATKYDGDILPIGFQRDAFKYQNQPIVTNGNAMLYLYTDGYHDQLSDDDARKMGSDKFEKLALENASLPLQDKEQHLKLAFDKWRGARRQIDDVCVVGVKI